MNPFRLPGNRLPNTGKLLAICICALFAVTAKGQSSKNQKLQDSLLHALDTASSKGSKLNIKYHLGIVTGKYTTAFWDSIIHDAHIAGDKDIEISALDISGFFLSMQGDVNRSIIYLKKAIQIRIHFNPLYHITEAYLSKGDIKNALDYGFSALKVAEQGNNHKHMALAYSQLGKVYARIGYVTKALKLHLQALKLTETYHLEASLEGLLVYGVASDYYELGDTLNAIKYFSRCGRYIDQLSPSALQAAMYNGAGLAHEIRHQPANARTCHIKAYEVAKQTDSKTILVNTLILLAGNAYNTEHFKQARIYADDAFVLEQSIKSKIHMPRIAKLLQKLSQKDNNYKDALHYSELYLQYRDSLANENFQNQAMEKEYLNELENKEYKNRILQNQNRIQKLVLKQKSYLTTGLVAGIVLLIIIFFMMVRQNKIKAERQTLYLKQKLLRIQMNPHFIFNALQAIQNVVLNNNKQHAVKYLSSFASLMREVLRNSNEDLITIKREILLVEHYLKLQKLRFGGRFEYTISQQESINDSILVPPMLGQPFIENAVEHGMKNRSSGGQINVSYTLISGRLNICIIDNGPGLNLPPDNTQHQSMAIAITKERINAMNKKQKEKIGFEIKNAFPDAINSKGVCIIFNLPLNLAV